MTGICVFGRGQNQRLLGAFIYSPGAKTTLDILVRFTTRLDHPASVSPGRFLTLICLAKARVLHSNEANSSRSDGQCGLGDGEEKRGNLWKTCLYFNHNLSA